MQFHCVTYRPSNGFYLFRTTAVDATAQTKRSKASVKDDLLLVRYYESRRINESNMY